MNPLTIAELGELKARSEVLCHFGVSPSGKPWREHIKNEVDEILAMSPEEHAANDKLLKDLFRGAQLKDRDARAQLCELVVTHTQNFVVPMQEWADFWDVRVLGEKDNAVIHNETQIEIAMYATGQDSRHARRMQVTKPEDSYLVNWENFTSEKVTWKIRDIQTGDVQGPAKRMFNLARDVARKMDRLMSPTVGNLASAFGAFDLTNENPAKRVYVTHSDIQSGILPESNHVEVSDLSATSTFGLEVLELAVDHGARFSGGTEDINGGGTLSPTGVIHVRADEIKEIAAGLVALGQKQTPLSESLVANGWYSVANYLGRDWVLKPSLTLPSGTAYVQLNRPVGIFFLKPSFDLEGTEFDLWNNRASIQTSRYYAWVIPAVNRRNALRVKYRL